MLAAVQSSLQAIQHIPASPAALITLFVMLGASVWVFAMLVRRETLRRQWVTIVQWARARGIRPVSLSDDQVIEVPLYAVLQPYHPKPVVFLQGTQVCIAQTSTDPLPTAAAVKPVWHLLSRRLESSWPVTGLRPTQHTKSIVDLFSLSSFPSLMSPERFVIFGGDSNAAKALAWSTLATLLPPDVGLLIHGNLLILDFSSRPFDQVEFGRVLDLAEQFAPRLDAAAVR